MDHDKQLAKMDPKLREAYERVMGTSHTASSNPLSGPTTPTPPPPTPQATMPSVEPMSSPEPPSSVASPQSPPTTPETPAEPLAAPPLPTSEASVTPSATPEEQTVVTPAPSSPLPVIPNVKPADHVSEMVHIGGSPVNRAPAPAQATSIPGVKKKGGSTLLTLGGLFVFFLVYTLICMKILGMSLPFVPKGVIPGF